MFLHKRRQVHGAEADGLAHDDRAEHRQHQPERRDCQQPAVQGLGTRDGKPSGELKTENIMQLLGLLEQVLPLTGSLGWRVTPLREHGINVDSYSEVTYGRSNIQITN